MDSLKKISKKTWTIIAAVAVVIVLLIGGVYYMNHRKISVVKNDEINMRFKGYDGSGVAVYNGTKMYKNMIDVMSKRVDLSDYWVNKLKDDPSSMTSSEDVSSEDRDKLTEMSQWMEETNVTLSKQTDLSNGDKVKLKVDTGNDKSNPIKEQTKEYKVKGLDKVKSVSTKSVLSDLDVSFAGFNGNGQVLLTSKDKKLDAKEFTVKKNGKLSNGDKIKVKAPSELFKKDGINYKGAKSVTVEVKGLKELDKISNVDAVKKVSDSLINDEYESNDFTKYENNFVSMYAVPRVSSSDDEEYDYYDEESDVPESTVQVNEYQGKAENTVWINVLYEVKMSDDDEEDYDSEYYNVVLRNLHYKDGKVDIEKLNTDEDSNIDSLSGSIDTEEHNLAADGVKLK